MPSATYSFVKETKNYRVYEPSAKDVNPDTLLGSLYVAKEALKGEPAKVKVSVQPAKGSD